MEAEATLRRGSVTSRSLAAHAVKVVLTVERGGMLVTERPPKRAHRPLEQIHRALPITQRVERQREVVHRRSTCPDAPPPTPARAPPTPAPAAPAHPQDHPSSRNDTARLFIDVNVCGCSSPNTRTRTSTTRSCNARAPCKITQLAQRLGEVVHRRQRVPDAPLPTPAHAPRTPAPATPAQPQGHPTCCNDTARLFIDVNVSGCSSPNTRPRTSNTRSCNAPRTRKITQPVQRRGEVVHRRQRVRMLLPEHPLPRLEHPFLEVDGQSDDRRDTSRASPPIRVASACSGSSSAFASWRAWASGRAGG